MQLQHSSVEQMIDVTSCDMHEIDAILCLHSIHDRVGGAAANATSVSGPGAGICRHDHPGLQSTRGMTS